MKPYKYYIRKEKEMKEKVIFLYTIHKRRNLKIVEGGGTNVSDVERLYR